MLQKIRELMNIKEEIETINKKIEGNSKIVSDLNNNSESLKKQLEETNALQKEFLQNLKENLDAIKKSGEDLSSEVFEFKLLKSQLQRKILEKFEEELRKELEINKESLKKDIEEYNELKKNAANIFSAMKSTNEEIKKFLDISRNIKKEDFQLANFARQVSYEDGEKLRLMRRVEQLESLIGKMRRERPRIG